MTMTAPQPQTDCRWKSQNSTGKLFSGPKPPKAAHPGKNRSTPSSRPPGGILHRGEEFPRPVEVYNNRVNRLFPQRKETAKLDTSSWICQIDTRLAQDQTGNQQTATAILQKIILCDRTLIVIPPHDANTIRGCSRIGHSSIRADLQIDHVASNHD